MKTRGLVLEGKRYWSPDGVAPPASLPDVSRWGNDGVFNGGVSWVRLPSGLWVLDFNPATSDYIAIPNMSMVSNKTFQIVAIPNFDYDVATQHFFFQWFVDVNNYINLDKIGPGTDTTFVVFAGGSGGTTKVTYPWSAGDVLIIHATIDYSAMPFARLYFNGVLVDDSGGLAPGNMTTTLHTFHIGCSRTPALPNDIWDGQLALPKIYGYALTADQVNKRIEAERRLLGV